MSKNLPKISIKKSSKKFVKNLPQKIRQKIFQKYVKKSVKNFVKKSAQKIQWIEQVYENAWLGFSQLFQNILKSVSLALLGHFVKFWA